MQRKEGFIDVTGGKVWYEIVGEKKDIPLLLVHGGPGYPHDYLEPLENLSHKRRIISYDQLGCGNSEKPVDTSLWTLERFVIELQEIIKTLGLKKYHILGHSWGAALAVSFAYRNNKGLKSLILSDPYISTPYWERDAKRLIGELPENMQKVLKKGDFDSKEYKKASKEFYFRFVWRLTSLPTPALRSNHKMSNEIYNYMWGPEEFRVSGTLKNLDLTSKLPQIKIPTLLLCGRYDEATPESTKYFQSLFPKAEMKVFEYSAHLPLWTEKEEYLKIVGDFLQSVE
ncbi:MAG: hypothetical protein A3F33_02570 [Candidatus Woykebacteria bacterium RIFCSPHIGHO2_12_FULL_43_10]|uniref:AB hydrolase-1 domain-containing protein n=2 Tax=Candidatus Woykeibacteriota TaxID=1817899 RepID=A0A1G1WUB2_9BACT|nr:MAG: hypothetical protein A3J50_03765 [Candidatus Woykebacteria bacterium RIFCSPHIGHO2_02_FULL_43_16b]OGY29886.1 MAG: hypothetical protein A3F33_02570 [Candidatus Woykebacteria bacterium RIFCSPHIGHO2_12_FULL_43_10]OGY31336.1 MAG: hypothetical protein A3A61_02580 [Candidatus Woykebacteria bacterium RIFCSPLOWO2_01_FULL_43_14]